MTVSESLSASEDEKPVPNTRRKSKRSQAGSYSNHPQGARSRRISCSCQNLISTPKTILVVASSTNCSKIQQQQQQQHSDFFPFRMIFVFFVFVFFCEWNCLKLVLVVSLQQDLFLILTGVLFRGHHHRYYPSKTSKTKMRFISRALFFFFFLKNVDKHQEVSQRRVIGKGYLLSKTRSGDDSQ